MGGLYCVRQQKKTQAEIQAEAQAKTQVSEAKEKREADHVRKKERRKLKQTTLKIAKLFCTKSS